MWLLKQIWLYEICGSILLKCQNTTMGVNEVWIKRYCSLCSKYITLCTVVITSLLVHDKPLGAASSVNRVYWTVWKLWSTTRYCPAPAGPMRSQGILSLRVSFHSFCVIFPFLSFIFNFEIDWIYSIWYFGYSAIIKHKLYIFSFLYWQELIYFYM